MNEASCTVLREWSHILLDFCGKHNITADVEVIQPEDQRGLRETVQGRCKVSLLH